jgi:hypothetical protein
MRIYPSLDGVTRILENQTSVAVVSAISQFSSLERNRSNTNDQAEAANVNEDYKVGAMKLPIISLFEKNLA